MKIRCTSGILTCTENTNGATSTVDLGFDIGGQKTLFSKAEFTNYKYFIILQMSQAQSALNYGTNFFFSWGMEEFKSPWTLLAEDSFHLTIKINGSTKFCLACLIFVFTRRWTDANTARSSYGFHNHPLYTAEQSSTKTIATVLHYLQSVKITTWLSLKENKKAEKGSLISVNWNYYDSSFMLRDKTPSCTCKNVHFSFVSDGAHTFW